MIASDLLYYNPFLLIEVNCYERARLTALGMTHGVKLAECCSQDRRRDSTDAREGFRVYVRGYSGKYFRGKCPGNGGKLCNGNPLRCSERPA